jgi:hypothetical protein
MAMEGSEPAVRVEIAAGVATLTLADEASFDGTKCIILRWIASVRPPWMAEVQVMQGAITCPLPVHRYVGTVHLFPQ